MEHLRTAFSRFWGAVPQAGAPVKIRTKIVHYCGCANSKAVRQIRFLRDVERRRPQIVLLPRNYWLAWNLL
jgi:hypothetical protein